jgi:peptidoglycan/LPS O-acetylase OafA/YrhL
VRSEIQALRCVAVLGVVLFHIWPDVGVLSGGFLGVDVFFVISGFLITSHVLREVDGSGSLSLSRFWARRVRRLLPAAFSVLLACLMALGLWIPRAYWLSTLRQVRASALYFQNWVLAGDAVDYFAQDESPSLVQHYWSLSAEEQFYIVWPLVTVFALWLAVRLNRRKRGTLFVLLALVVVVSFVYSVVYTATDPQRAYFVTPTRAWEFGLGGLLAFAPRIVTFNWRRLDAIQVGLSWLGLLLVGGSFVRFDGSMALPGYLCLVPVVGALLVIWADHSGSPLAPTYLGDFGPVQFLGGVSYSLYLWHWPAVILYPYWSGHEPGLRGGLVVLTACIAASALSKKLIEDPFRHADYWQAVPRRAYVFAVLGMALVVTISWGFTLVEQQRAARQAEIATQLAEGSYPCFGANALMQPPGACDNDPELDDKLFPSLSELSQQRSECWNEIGQDGPWGPCHMGGDTSPTARRVAIVGDSHAGYFATGAVAPNLRLWGWNADFYIGRDCYLSSPAPIQQCEQLLEQLWATDYDLVIVGGAATRPVADEAATAAAIQRAFGRLKAAQIVVLRDNPRPGTDVESCIRAANGDLPETLKCGFQENDTTRFPSDRFVRAATDFASNVSVIDLSEFYCQDGWCPAVVGHVIVYCDYGHVSHNYWETLAPYFFKRLP